MHLRRLAALAVLACFLVGGAVAAEEQVLFDFASPAAIRAWAPVKLPGVETDAPAPQITPAPGGKGLRLIFHGGDWPALATSQIPIAGTWKSSGSSAAMRYPEDKIKDAILHPDLDVRKHEATRILAAQGHRRRHHYAFPA